MILGIETVYNPPSFSGGSFFPPADNLYDLGSVALSWRNIYFETAIFGGSVTGNWNPSADDTYTNGGNSARWKEGWYSDLVSIGVYDATDTTMLQVRSGSAGTVSPLAGTNIVIENNGATYLTFLSPAANSNGIIFGSPTSNNQANILYSHALDSLNVQVKAIAQLAWTDGAFAFQKATTISSTAGDLTVQSVASNLHLKGGTVFINLGISGGTYFNYGIGTGQVTVLDGTTATDGQANDSPTLVFKAKYDADAGAGVTSTAWDYSILHDMITAGAAPKSQAIHSINNVTALALQNDNGTITTYLYGGAGSNIATVSSGGINILSGAVSSTQFGFSGDAAFFAVSNVDSRYAYISARDNGVGLVEIARFAGAADPYLQIGRSDTGVATNAVTDMLVLQAGAGDTNVAAGFGYGISVKLSNDAHEVEERASLDFALTAATNGSEAANIVFNLMDAGSIAASWTMEPNTFRANKTGALIRGFNADDGYLYFGARDNGVGVVEVARLAGAEDPYFSMGGSQQHKFTNAGLIGFHGATPIAQAVLATGAGAVVDDVITALQNLGLVKQS